MCSRAPTGWAGLISSRSPPNSHLANGHFVPPVQDLGPYAETSTRDDDGCMTSSSAVSLGPQIDFSNQMVRNEEGSDSNEAMQPRIVVGIDGSQNSLSALEWAAREACFRGASLEVVHATFLRHDAMELDSLAWLKAHESAVLDKAVAKARSLRPGLVVGGRLGDPPAAELLVDVGKDAELLVVGSRGLGHFKELALGSVSQDCARRAQCPLVIIGPRAAHAGTVADGARRSHVGGRRL